MIRLLACVTLLIIVATVLFTDLKEKRRQALALVHAPPARSFHVPAAKVMPMFEQAFHELVDALDAAGVRFFISDGSAIGLLRQGYFIPHDHDVDIGMFYEGPAHARRVFNALNKVFHFDPMSGNWDNSPKYCWQMMFMHQKVPLSVDIFFYYPQDGTDMADLDAFYDGVGTSGLCYYCSTGPKQMIKYPHQPFRLYRGHFLNRTVSVVEEKWVAATYGKHWRIPHNYGYFEGVEGLFTNAKVESRK